MAELHVFHDGQDWYIAMDAADAHVLRVGLYSDELPEDAGPLEQLPDDEIVGVLCNENGRPDDHGTGVNKAAGEWAKQEGRGVLCSMEF